MRVYDISPAITEDLGVFPGDVAFRRHVHMDFRKGDHLLLSSIEATLHLGAHADAPSHYDPDGMGIGERFLEPYLGTCQLIRVDVEPGTRVYPIDLEMNDIICRRVLFATHSFPDPNNWNSNFCSLSPELIDELALRNVLLVGIDTPSIDPEDAKNLASHQTVATHHMAILEGLVLNNVPQGVYTLMALPLRLVNADASPVRALLLPPGLLPDEPLDVM